MIYILVNGESVRLGGQVADEQMLREGWVPYYGPIPVANEFRFIDGELIAVNPDPLPEE